MSMDRVKMFNLKQNSRSTFNQRPDTGKILFRLEDVGVNYKKVAALKNISMQISDSDFLFITGASGAGKTTLMNLLARHFKPDRGRIYRKTLKGGEFIAEIFQDLRLIDDLTIEENLFLVFDRKIHKNKNNFYSELLELVRYFGISDKLTNKISEANGGLKQQVAIIRSLLTKPTILIADEPTCSMDRQSASRVFDLLSYYNTKRGLTVIWSSHNRELVKEFNGKTIHLDCGKIVYSGYACFI